MRCLKIARLPTRPCKLCCARLEKKGYVLHEVQGKAHLFSAAVKRDEVIKRTVGDFVNRLFGGDPLPLILHLADHSELRGGRY